MAWPAVIGAIAAAVGVVSNVRDYKRSKAFDDQQPREVPDIARNQFINLSYDRAFNSLPSHAVKHKASLVSSYGTKWDSISNPQTTT